VRKLHHEELNDLYCSTNIVCDNIEKNKMGEACSAYGGGERRVQGFGGGNLRERDHWGDPVVDGRIKLSWIFEKWDVGVWIGSSWLRIGTGDGHL